MPQEMIICDTPESIDAFRLLALKGALKLEVLGMTRSGSSAYSIVKKEFGFKGSKKVVLEKFEAHLTEKGVLRCKS